MTGPSGLTDRELLDQATENKEKAFLYDSGVRVGAALETGDGTIYDGANIEVSGRTTSIHAEMTAFFIAVLYGASEFERIAIATDGSGGVTFPCSLCQHTMAQFTHDIEILEWNDGEIESRQLTDLIHEDTYRPRKKVIDTRGRD